MACVMSARTAPNTDLPDRRPTRGAVLLVLCSSLFGAPCAQALELGPLSVHSTLGERLSAEVEIASTDGDDLDGIRASLADIATYERFGVARPDVLSTVDISLRTDEGGTPVVRIRSSAPVHELFLNVLLRIEERDVQLIREVAILLDPLVTQAMPERTDGSALATPSADTAYTVRAGDSLMRIAERFAPPATSAEQTAVALYEANPEAFLGSIHRLIVGASLTLPSAEAARAHSPRAARRVIRTGIEAFQRRLAGDDPLPADTTARSGDATARAGSPDGGTAALPLPADLAVLPLEDDLALQDFQAVIVNLKGNLYELQGTLDERIERLDGLHARVDELIDERVRIRESAERDAPTVGGAEQVADEAGAAARAVERAAATARRVTAPATERAAELEKVFAEDAEKRIATADVRPAPGTAKPQAPASEATERSARSGPGETAGPDRGEASDATVEVSPAPLARDGLPPVDATAPTFAGVAGLESLVRSGAPDETTKDFAPIPSDAPGAAETGDADVREDADDTARSGDPGTASAASPVDGRPDVGSDERRSLDVSSIRSALSGWTLDRSMQVLRDGGLLALALCLVFVLVGRRYRKRGDPRDVPLNDDAALDLYLSQSSDAQLDAETLRSLLERAPDRQDIRLRLLERYARDGSMTQFAAEAQVMYRMTLGNTPEWYRVVELGLELDADIDFYRVANDDPFDLKLDLGLSDEDRVSSVPGGTDVGRGDRFAPVVSFAEFFAQNNVVDKSDEGAPFDEATTPDGAPDESPRGPEDVSPARADDTSPAPPEDFGAAPPADFSPVSPEEFSPLPPSDLAPAPSANVTPVPLAERPVYVPEDPAELIAISVNYAYGVDKLGFDLGEPDDLDAAMDIDSSRPEPEPEPEPESMPEPTLEAMLEFEPESEPEPESELELEPESEKADFLPTLEFDDDAGIDEHDTRSDATDAAADDMMSIVADAAAEPVRRHDDVAAEFMDFESSMASNEGFAILEDEAEDDDDLVIDVAFQRDDVGLQLDLAETYAENGCDEKARRLLDEILPRADADQRTRVDALIERLSGRQEPDRSTG